MAEKLPTVSLADQRKLENASNNDDTLTLDSSENVDPSIPMKFRGTDADRRDMCLLGKKQELRRNFGFFTMVGFASTVIVSWEVLPTIFSFVLINGGAPLLFWGEIAVMLGMTLVYLSLAEMASMSPTAGGQYHWVSEFGPPKYQKGLSYAVGWLIVMGWQAFLAAVCFGAGTIMQGLIALNDESYAWHRWQGTLLTIGCVTFAILFNTVFAHQLPLFEGTVLIVHLVGFVAIIAPLWALAPRAPIHTSLFEFQNNGGWPTLGLSSMVGLITPLSSMLGFDCSVHMAEEIHDASRTLPKAILWSVLLNATLAFGMAVTLVFCMGDPTSLLETTTGWPFIQLFYNTTQSYAATNVLTCIIIFMYLACDVSLIATSSRQLWSFARDGGLPCSAWLSVVPSGWQLPIRSVVISFVVTCALACINIGSTTALNAINSFAVVPVLASYAITIGCLIWRRLYGAPLPPRRWTLGRYGLAINIAAVLFLIPVFIFAFWPLTNPVTAESMNWSSVMFGGVLIVAALWYMVSAKHTYTAPVALVKREY